jgi:hypothetical protein
VRRWIDRSCWCTSVEEQGGDSRRRRRTGSHRGRTVLSGFPTGWEPPGSHTIGARTPRTQPLISSVATIRSTPGWPVSGAGPGCGPTLASNDAARPTLGVATTGGVARAGHDRTQRRARSLTIDVVGGAGVSCLLVFTFRGITSVARQRFSTRPAVLAGGERCVARTRSPGRRRGGHPLA